MPRLSIRTYSRYPSEQRVLNNFPPGSRAREETYSVASQLVHPLGAALEEMAGEAGRVSLQLFPLTVDPFDLDVLYRTPLKTSTNVKGIINSSEITISSSPRNNLDAFWYDALPTRLELQDTGLVSKWTIDSITQSNFPWSLGSSYKGMASLFGSSIISSTGTAYWTFTNCSATYSTSSGWGNGPYIYLNATNAATATATATAPSTGIPYMASFRVKKETSTGTAVFGIGYKATGTAFYTAALDPAWSHVTLFYQPSSSSETGIPFVTVRAASGVTLDISQPMMVPYYTPATTPYPLCAVIDEFPYWAYLKVTGGSDLLECNTGMGGPPRPSLIEVEGITNKGSIERERFYPFYSGEFRSLKPFSAIRFARITNINPSTAQVSLQLHHFRSTSQIRDEAGFLVTPDHEGPLYYSLSATGASSILEYQTFHAPSIEHMVGGNDGISTYYKLELVGTDGTSPISLVDIETDPYRRQLWAASTNGLLLYNVELPWSSRVSDLSRRTINPNTIIDIPLTLERVPLRNDTVRFSANWLNRHKELLGVRWLVTKPDGTLKEVDVAGSESTPSAGGNWIYNEDAGDQQSRWHPVYLDYTMTAHGDYTIHLEARYQYENQIVSETDLLLVTVGKKAPVWYTTANPLDSTSIYGLDLDPQGYLRLASTRNDSTQLLNLARFNIRYDYYLDDERKGIKYFREKYNWVEVRT